MKRIMLMSACMLIFFIWSDAQNVGIGTNSPTAQLHTTGTIRHAFLSGAGIRPVFVDGNGNLLTSLPALPPSSATNNASQAIPDFSCTGVTSVNNLAGLPGSIQSGSIKVTVNITHPKLSDLSIYLTAPNGSIINLSAPSASLSGANFSNTVFTDAGALLSSGTAPFTGNFKPLADMTPSICGVTPNVSTFSAIGNSTVNPNGNWTLRVIDNTAGNTGSLQNWTISVVSPVGIDGVWGLNGNAGTNVYNFLGTTDDAALHFRVRNINAGIIDSASYNTGIGYRALDSVTTGKYNVAYGNNALKRNKTGSYNVALGTSAHERHISGENNTVVGAYALYFNQSTGSDNAVLGTAAMLNSTSGSHNVSVGSSSLVQNQGGSYNTAVGDHALYGINANGTVAVGTYALGLSIKADHLVAVGDSALYNNGGGATETFEGSANVAVGSKALFTNTTGYANTSVGTTTLFSNVNGAQNTGVGTSALFYNNGNNNTAIGAYALINNSAGNNNTAVGEQALSSNTNSNNNSAHGYFALGFNLTGNNNAALGSEALFSNISGNSNVAVGIKALYYNFDRSNLVAIGDSALYNNAKNPTAVADGTNNTAVGSKAMYNNNTGYSNTALGRNALLNNNSGTLNTAVGNNTLLTITSGNSNTAIGAGADIFNGSFSNASAIGAGAIAPSSNSIQLGNGSVTNIYTNNNANLWVGNVFIKGNGIIRNTSSLQLKMETQSKIVSASIPALSTISIPITFSTTFSTNPVVYVGNITGGPGGFAEVIMSIANVSTTGATLFVNNPRGSTWVPNFTVNIVAIGGE